MVRPPEETDKAGAVLAPVIRTLGACSTRTDSAPAGRGSNTCGAVALNPWRGAWAGWFGIQAGAARRPAAAAQDIDRAKDRAAARGVAAQARLSLTLPRAVRAIMRNPPDSVPGSAAQGSPPAAGAATPTAGTCGRQASQEPRHGRISTHPTQGHGRWPQRAS